MINVLYRAFQPNSKLLIGILRGLAGIISLAFYCEFLYLKKISFDLSLGTIILGLVICVVACSGLWMMTFPIGRRFRYATLLLFIPPYLVSSILFLEYVPAFGMFIVLFLPIGVINCFRTNIQAT